MIHDELAGHSPDGAIVASNVSGVIRLNDIALQADSTNTGRHGLAHDGGERSALVRRDNQQIGLLQDQCFDLRNLFAGILLAVANAQPDVGGTRANPAEQIVLCRAIGLGIVALAERNKILLPGLVPASATRQSSGQQYRCDSCDNPMDHVSLRASGEIRICWIHTAATIIAAFNISSVLLSTLLRRSMLVRMPVISVPATVPPIEPAPPARLDPPITTAAIASSS